MAQASAKNDVPAAGRQLRLDVLVVLLTIADGALKVLLERTGSRWTLPSATPAYTEPLRRAAERVTQHQLGAKVDYLEQLYTFGNAIPAGRTQRMVEVSYYGLVERGSVDTEADGKSRVAWFSERDQPELAGEHGTVIKVAKERLRGKVMYTAVGFELLPREFTLTDLQRLYEIILGRKLDKRNFRRKVEGLGILEPTGRLWANPRGRHAELWRFKPEVFRGLKAKRDILAF